MSENKAVAATQTTDLAAHKPIGVNLVTNYWTPLQIGESKRICFVDIKLDKSTEDINHDTAEIETKSKMLNTAFFVDPVTREVWRNASSRLVGALERANIAYGTPLEITYTGKQRNSTNAFSSDNWSVFVLGLPAQP